MAPLPPSKMRAAGASTNSRSRARNNLLSSRRSNLFDDVFRTSKKDKRIIKHSTFMHKIEKSHKKTTTKRQRRPSKKLVADLESLAEALPANLLENHEHPQVNIIKHKTLKNRPGAMKRKEKLEQLERDRFMKNMAQMNMMAPSTVAATEPATDMSDTIPVGDEQNSTSGRWAALRNFINQTMDRQPAFNQK